MSSAAFSGMDIGQVRQFATQLGQRASEIDTLLQQLTNQLSSTTWQGPDATQFRNDWQSTHATALRNVANALRDAQNKASTNATEQENTSAR
ncbi:MAG: WXG100 family type VII secretion target [Propionibacteriaceae bacterium]|nr:WXG100 family type VII secretion target [Propionibacteriaceae bacterium]